MAKNVRDVMTPNPKCVSERDSILQAARIMRDEDTGVVPVVDGKKVIGVITDRDIVVRVIADGKDLNSVKINEVMTKQVRTVKEDQSVDDVLKLMGGSEIRRVPVVNQGNEIVGIISIGDLSTRTDKDDQVGRAIEQISEARPNH
ncbi:MAG TPA: CBS domain-containing protein [Thermoanaerobaculia bacterium]|nr:CBS domain-containing protein [Thermoanaerobaculia bacterium]